MPKLNRYENIEGDLDTIINPMLDAHNRLCQNPLTQLFLNQISNNVWRISLGEPGQCWHFGEIRRNALGKYTVQLNECLSSFNTDYPLLVKVFKNPFGNRGISYDYDAMLTAIWTFHATYYQKHITANHVDYDRYMTEFYGALI